MFKDTGSANSSECGNRAVLGWRTNTLVLPGKPNRKENGSHIRRWPLGVQVWQPCSQLAFLPEQRPSHDSLPLGKHSPQCGGDGAALGLDDGQDGLILKDLP